MRLPGWKSVGKTLLFTEATPAAAVAAGSMATGRLLVRPSRKRDCDCIPEPKRLEVFPGVGHEDLLMCNPRRYIRAVDAFLEEFGKGEPVDRSLPGPPADLVRGA